MDNITEEYLSEASEQLLSHTTEMLNFYWAETLGGTSQELPHVFGRQHMFECHPIVAAFLHRCQAEDISALTRQQRAQLMETMQRFLLEMEIVRRAFCDLNQLGDVRVIPESHRHLWREVIKAHVAKRLAYQ